LMESLVSQSFAKKKTEGVFKKKEVYSLNEGIVKTLGSKGAYDPILAKDKKESEEDSDYEQEAHEFNLASYNAFLSNAYVQAATKYFHDRYCKEGVVIGSVASKRVFKIYGDQNMLNAGALEGVKFAAETSQMSREAIFNIVNGTPGQASPVGEIEDRLPTFAFTSSGKKLALDKWNEDLKALGYAGDFKKAMDSGALVVYKAQTGISKGNALDLGKMTEGILKEQKAKQNVEDADEGF